MIAVFIRHEREFDMCFGESTPNLFKMIRNINDVRGIKFIGVVVVQGWWHMNSQGQLDDKERALAELEIRQPELFKKQK